MRPSSRRKPLSVKASRTGVSRIFASTVLVSLLPAAFTAFR